MSHIQPEGKTQRHRRADCRKGRHDFGENQSIGAGIARRVCDACGSVTIDLTPGEELTAPVVPSPDTIIDLIRQE